MGIAMRVQIRVTQGIIKSVELYGQNTETGGQGLFRL